MIWLLFLGESSIWSREGIKGGGDLTYFSFSRSIVLCCTEMFVVLFGDKGLLMSHSMSFIKSMVVCPICLWGPASSFIWGLRSTVFFYSSFPEDYCFFWEIWSFELFRCFDHWSVEYFSEFLGFEWELEIVLFDVLSNVWLLALLLLSSLDSNETLQFIAFADLRTLKGFVRASFVLWVVRILGLFLNFT